MASFFRSQPTGRLTGYAFTRKTDADKAAEIVNADFFGASPAPSGTIVLPGAGSLAFAGYAPSITQTANQAVTVGAGALTLTGYAPTVAQSSASGVSPGAGSLAITGYAPNVIQTVGGAVSLFPDAGALIVTGYAPTVAQSGQEAPPSGGGGVGGSGNVREVRAFADLLSKARPTKAAKKRLRRVLEVEALELLPGEPEAVKAASIIAQVVAKKEIQAIERRPVDAAPLAALPFDPSAEIQRMVAEWMQNEAIQRELEDEEEIEALLLG